jgi:hypothetical protein
MIKSTKFLAAAALTGLVLGVAGLATAPVATSANAAAGQGGDFVSDRIGGAFASIVEIAPDQALTDAAARVAKGDFLGKPGCLGAVWPNISPECLTTAEGAPVEAVRTVTVGYQEGESTTILMRMPAPEVASR